MKHKLDIQYFGFQGDGVFYLDDYVWPLYTGAWENLHVALSSDFVIENDKVMYNGRIVTLDGVDVNPADYIIGDAHYYTRESMPDIETINFLTTNTDLISIADAIREKCGTTDKLAYPDGFVSAIDTLSKPSGNINLTNTSSTDVTNYETAQVVDSNLVASNIKKDISILGVTGTYEGLTRQEVVDLIYPVGAIYLSYTSVNPSVIFGGSWTKIEDSFLIGASSKYALDSTGGSDTHTLTINEMPSHNHAENDNVTINAKISSGNGYFQSSGTYPLNTNNSFSTRYKTGSTGGGQAFSIMPPYIAVEIWRRTA